MYFESNIEQVCCVCIDIRDDFNEKTVGNAKLLNDYEKGLSRSLRVFEDPGYEVLCEALNINYLFQDP